MQWFFLIISAWDSRECVSPQLCWWNVAKCADIWAKVKRIVRGAHIKRMEPWPFHYKTYVCNERIQSNIMVTTATTTMMRAHSTHSHYSRVSRRRSVHSPRRPVNVNYFKIFTCNHWMGKILSGTRARAGTQRIYFYMRDDESSSSCRLIFFR